MSVNAAAPAAFGSRAPMGGSGSDYQAVLRDPKFQELARSRSSFGWMLTALILIIYFGFIFLVALDKPLLAQKVGGGRPRSGSCSGSW